jgi:pilus assembly protein Flp/PilA
MRAGRSAFPEVVPTRSIGHDFGKLRLAYRAEPGLPLRTSSMLFVNLHRGGCAMSCERPTEFIDDERGVTAIEYCIIAAMLSILIVTGARLIGINLSGNFFGPLAASFP